jgi:hypothetical protein
MGRTTFSSRNCCGFAGSRDCLFVRWVGCILGSTVVIVQVQICLWDRLVRLGPTHRREERMRMRGDWERDVPTWRDCFSSWFGEDQLRHSSCRVNRIPYEILDGDSLMTAKGKPNSSGIV